MNKNSMKNKIINTLSISLDADQKTLENIADNILDLFNVSDSFNEGYEKGYRDSTSQACREIAKNFGVCS